MEELKNLPGLKKQELKKCALCDQGMMHSGDIQFYRLSLESFVIDHRGVQETSGMEQMMGGGSFGAMMAGVMGTNPDIAKQMFQEKNMLVCSPCMMSGRLSTILSYIEAKSDEDAKNEH